MYATAHNGARRVRPPFAYAPRFFAQKLCGDVVCRDTLCIQYLNSSNLLGSVVSDNFCVARVDPWYLYEASLRIVGFVLLHKVPKERSIDEYFENFGPNRSLGSKAFQC
jgi:hypothetical protein